MIQVTYALVQEEKNMMIDIFTKTFPTPEDRAKYEMNYRDNWCKLVVRNVTTIEGESQ